jgi:hypothetical protein
MHDACTIYFFQMSPTTTIAITTGLLIASNVFMTFAWYGHLKNLTTSPLWIAGQPHRIYRDGFGSVKDSAGGHYAGGLHSVFDSLHASTL